MTTQNPSSPPRLIAPGGLVTRAVQAGRGEAIDIERAGLRFLRDSIVARLRTDSERLAQLDRAVAVFQAARGAA